MEEYARRAGMALYNAQLYEQAQTANRLKDEFLSTLSHELRTPANAILGWAQMAQDGAAKGRDISHALEAVLRNAHAQNDLISDILDAQRLTIGKVRLELGEVDIDRVVAEAVESVRPTAVAKRVDLRPQLSEGCTVIGDGERLQQVLWNLLSNAIKFTPTGGSVDIDCRRSRRGVTIEVRDTGPGIAPEFLPFVFERFRQADSSATKSHSGLGLGLAIAKNLTELHGGTIEAANRTDGQTGAKMCVHLPARDVQE
jgi:signal transduction histidine kinase